MKRFDDDSVQIDLLKKYAYQRWAALPKDIIPLTAADPDFQVAPEIREAISQLGKEGIFSYGKIGGNHDLRKELAKNVFQRKKNICTCDDIFVLNGVAQCMMLVTQSVCKAGDEIIIFDPVDLLFGLAIDRAQCKRVYSPVEKSTGEFDIDGLNELITKNTRMICVCNPHNPLGRTMTRKEVKGISEIANDYDLYIMSDEIWSDIIYDGKKHISTASIDSDASDRTFSLYGFSKTFAMAGLHLGFVVVTNKEYYRKLSKTASSFFPVNNISQEAGKVAYSQCWYWVKEFVAHLQKNRDYVYEQLTSIDGVSCLKPEGTFTIFPDISSFNLSSEEMTKYLYNEAKVAVVPGHRSPLSYFGPGGGKVILDLYSRPVEI
jgi:aspartate/methionine/tyrosine aminotransferase